MSLQQIGVGCIPCGQNAAAAGSGLSGRKGHAWKRPTGQQSGKRARAAWLWMEKQERKSSKGINKNYVEGGMNRTTRGLEGLERKDGDGEEMEMKPKSRKFSNTFSSPSPEAWRQKQLEGHLTQPVSVPKNNISIDHLSYQLDLKLVLNFTIIISAL